MAVLCSEDGGLHGGDGLDEVLRGVRGKKGWVGDERRGSVGL